MNKFWRWVNDENERTLLLNGEIATESWLGDEVTPEVFKGELMSGSGDITIWINSPGGDCIAAAQIYNMMLDYSGKITVKIDGLAASAASVIAMAGDRVLMSPVSMLMIHNPSTIAMGDRVEMGKAIEMLDAVKESIINAYEVKTGLRRSKISELMDKESWMDALKSKELGFCDEIMKREQSNFESEGHIFQKSVAEANLKNKLEEKYLIKRVDKKDTGVKAKELLDRLNVIKKFI